MWITVILPVLEALSADARTSHQPAHRWIQDQEIDMQHSPNRHITSQRTAESLAMIEELLMTEGHSIRTEDDAVKAIDEYVGARNGQGLRIMIDEVQSLPATDRDALDVLRQLVGADHLPDSPAVGEVLISRLREVAHAVANEMAFA